MAQVLGPLRSWHTALGRPPIERVWNVAAVVVYLALVLGGVTQSSLGIDTLREDPTAPTGIMFGHALGIRSDEYLTGSARALGKIATGVSDDFNPLTAPDQIATGLPSTPASSLVLFDGALLGAGAIPDQMLFAARWWLPFLLLALGAPVFFRFFTGSRYIGMFAAAVLVFSPSSAWWSFGPIAILGFTLAGAASMINAAEAVHRHRAWTAAGWMFVASVLLARTPLHYQPWAIVLAVPVLIAAVVGVIAGHRRDGLISAGIVGVGALGLFGFVVLENLAGMRAMLGTVYPGQRVATGAPQQLGEVFGATSLAQLAHLPVTGSNPCEISSSYAALAAWAVVLLSAGLTVTKAPLRWALAVLLPSMAFWFAWSLIDFGSVGSKIPIVSLVPAPRAADMLGFLAIVVICMILPSAPPGRRRNALLSGAIVWMLAANAGSLLRGAQLPDLSLSSVWVSSALFALVVILLTWHPRLWVGYAAAVVLAASLMISVNPVIIGLGDLRGSPVAQQMLAQGENARKRGEVWVSDNLYVDSLFLATGVPSLSGRQLAAPSREAWLRLVPTGTDEAIWNRGASFVWFNWDDSANLTLSNPSTDQILIKGSPCSVSRAFPELTTVVSGHELKSACLTAEFSFMWSGSTHWVYRVR